MEGILLLVSLLLRKGGFSSLSSTVEVACPFYVKECFVLGLSFCLSRDIKSIHGASGVFLLWGWGNTFLFVRSLLLIQRRLIWTKSLIIGYYERNQYCPTGRKTAETENVGSSAVRSMEEGRADVVHRNVTSVTTPGVTPSLMLPSATQLDWASVSAIIEDLVLPKSTPISNKSNSINTPSISVEVLQEDTFLASINNNEELLLARIVTSDLESTSQLARTIGVNPINALKKYSKGNQFQVAAIVVIRDNNGVVMASCSEKIHQAYKPDEVEALAALKAVTFARELGFQRATLEGDSLGQIKALKSTECSLSPIGLLVDDVKRVANSFERLLYSHVKRNDNRVAHSLAKNALRISDFQVWMEDVVYILFRF